jgi:outer membrane protein assembly factor BamB
MASTTRFALALALPLLAAGCGWFGGSEDPPLPGKRISILVHEQSLTPDPQAAGNQILLPAPSVNASWPEAGGYANHAMYHIAVGADLKKAWSASIGKGANSGQRMIMTPIVADGRVYAMDVNAQVSAFDAQSGRSLWRIDLTPKEDDDGLFGGGLAFDEGKVFVTTGFAQVIALDAATGKILWRKSMAAPIHAAPTARGGRLFVITLDNKAFALDAADGSQLWTNSGLGETASILGAASPAEDGGVVVVPYSSGELVALRVENGLVLWTESLVTQRRIDIVSSLADIRGRPAIDRGRVFAVSHSDLMVSIDLRTGQRVWEREIGGIESPWVAGPVVYVVSGNEELVAVSRDTGRILWVTQLPRWKDEKAKKDPLLWSGPVLVSDRLLVAGSTGEVLAVSPYTGAIMGKIKMSDPVTVAPVVANGTIFFVTADAELVAYR